MNVKVLLTTPPFDSVIEPLYDQPSFVRTSLALLSGYLRAKNQCELKCIDAKFEQKKIDTLLQEILLFKPQLVCISSYTYEIISAGFLAEKIKNFNPSVITIIGGSHISAIPQSTLEEFKFFDIGVVGEGEETLSALCNAIGNNESFFNVDGIAYRDVQNKIIVNKEREKVQDLNTLPFPAWDLLPAAKEYFIQTSRGCPFNCNFCFNPNGKKVRIRSVENVMNEIEWLINDFHPERISFGDEAFAANKTYSDDLMNAFIRNKIGHRVRWDAQTHISFISEPLLLKMKKANIQKLEMGVESGNEELLQNMGKNINKAMVEKTFRLVKKHKIKTGAFFIFGHPDETKSSIWETIRFAIRINPHEPILAIMVPFPGSKVYDYSREGLHGYTGNSRNWNYYRKQINYALNFSGFSQKKLKTYLLIGYVSVFLMNFRFYGLLKFLYKNRKSAISFLKNRNKTELSEID
jgi:anaerobic magnesium-protoporphyrin IX monomethyl ester cyclase